MVEGTQNQKERARAREGEMEMARKLVDVVGKKRCPKFGGGDKHGMCEGDLCMAWFEIPLRDMVTINHKPDCKSKGKVLMPGQDQCLECLAFAKIEKAEDMDKVGACVYMEAPMWLTRAIQSLGGMRGGNPGGTV